MVRGSLTIHRIPDPPGSGTDLRRGTAAVELALLLPLLAALILGTCEIGQALRVHAILSDAARNGCAMACEPGVSNGQVIQQVQNALSGGGMPTDCMSVTVLVNNRPGNVAQAQRNDKISISISLPTSRVAWTGKFLFLANGSLQSETTVMLKQG